MKTNKPTLFSHFWLNYKWGTLFIIASDLFAVLLVKTGNMDLLSFRLWFWSSVFVLNVLVIGSIISFRKTYPKK